jgi:hypothetical protein
MSRFIQPMLFYRDPLLTLGPDKLHVKGEKVGFIHLPVGAFFPVS